MANNTLQISIVAKDLASKVLVQVSKDVLASGKAASTAGRGWQTLGQVLRANQAEIAAGGRAFVRLAAQVGQAGADTEQSLFGVQAAYRETGADWIAWSHQMQSATTFSDEAFMRSAQNVKTLITNYNLTTGQARELIVASADLAAVNRIDVYDAVTRVQSAIRGEAEASEYLGLTLNDTYMKNQALGGALRDTWETLDDNTKAQHRYNELLRQAAYAQGQAAAATETSAGRYRRLQNAIQDQAAALGRTINQSGPWLQMLDDGLGLVDQLAPLYSALTLRRIADTTATGAHTAAQIADNAAMAEGAGATGVLTRSLGSAGLLGTLGQVALLAGVTAGTVKLLRDYQLDASVAVDGHAVAVESAGIQLDKYNLAAFKATDLLARNAEYMQLLREKYDAGAIGVEAYARMLIVSGEELAAGSELMRTYNSEIERLRASHDAGALSAGQYNERVADLARVTGQDLAVAYRDAGIAAAGYTQSLGKGKLGTDDLRMSTDDLTTSLDRVETGLHQVRGALDTAFTGDAAVAGIAAQKEAYRDLLALPGQRAEVERRWDAIIAAAAQQSSDQRVQAALGALTRENAAHQAAVVQLKSEQRTYQEWVAAEEQRIAQLRVDGQWQVAGEAEQSLLLIQEWHRQHDTTISDLEQTHLARVKALQGEYRSAVQATTDHNLRLQIARRDSALSALDDEERRLREVMATGKTAADEWEGAWKRAQEKFRTKGSVEFDKWYAHVKKKLDEPVTFEIQGVYVPPTQGTHGGARGDVAAAGGIWTTPTRVLLGEAGAEAVIPLTRPRRAVEIMRQSGLDRLAANAGMSVIVTGNEFSVREEADIAAIAAAIMEQAGHQARNLARAGGLNWQ